MTVLFLEMKVELAFMKFFNVQITTIKEGLHVHEVERKTVQLYFKHLFNALNILNALRLTLGN